jgi:hypothetical protein
MATSSSASADPGNIGFTRTETFCVHGDKEIEVVYTNEEETVMKNLQLFEEWYEHEKENKFVGLDLEYTKEDPIYEIYLAVLQLCMKNRVLVYHFSVAYKFLYSLVKIY